MGGLGGYIVFRAEKEHVSMGRTTLPKQSTDTRDLRMVFESGMQYFPTRIGGMFHRDSHGRTPFQIACNKHGKEKVKTIIDDALNNSSHQKIDVETTKKALVYAATERGVDLDGVYFLLRRESTLLLARAKTTTTTARQQD